MTEHRKMLSDDFLPDRPLHLVVLLGGTRPQSPGRRLAAWFVERAHGRPEMRATVLDPGAYDLSDQHDRRRFAAEIDRADGVVVVTPEYNHGYPARLKEAIDSAYVEWRAKPVGFVSYGGSAGGVRAVEQLRQVFAELHMPSMRDGVMVPNVHAAFDDAGNLRQPERYDTSLARLLDQLHWWGTVLRQGRQAFAYSS